MASRRIACPAVLVALTLSGAPALADCILLPFNTTQPIVERFMFRPESLLRDYPEGGDAMRRAVWIMGVSSRAAVPQIIRIGRTANLRQRAAIGSGLGLAARQCESGQPYTARSIEAAVKAAQDVALFREFAANYKSQTAERAGGEAARRAPALQNQWLDRPSDNRPRGSASVPTGQIPISGPINPLPSIKPIR